MEEQFQQQRKGRAMNTKMKPKVIGRFRKPDGSLIRWDVDAEESPENVWELLDEPKEGGTASQVDSGFGAWSESGMKA